MASSGVMIRLYADALVLPEAHVAARYRALREAGLVTKGSRGRFAPDVLPLDGARLLIALMGAQAIAETEAVTEILGKAACAIVEGEDDALATDLSELDFESALSLILEACASYRLGDPSFFERRGQGVSIELSPTNLTAAILRPGFRAVFSPALSKAFPATQQLSESLSITDRLWLRSDRTGLKMSVSVDSIELLELAPALGPSDSVYIPTH